MSEKLRVVEGLHASYYCVTRQDMKRFHFIKGDLEGLVNEPLRIKGHKFSISLREDTERDNLILVSLRSVDDFPCNKVSEQFSMAEAISMPREASCSAAWQRQRW